MDFLSPQLVLVRLRGCKEWEGGATGMTATWCGGIVTVMVVTSLVPNLFDIVSKSVS